MDVEAYGDIGIANVDGQYHLLSLLHGSVFVKFTEKQRLCQSSSKLLFGMFSPVHRDLRGKGLNSLSKAPDMGYNGNVPQ